MAMNSETLTLAIKAKVVAKNPDFAGQIGDNMDWLFEAMAEAMVEHLTTQAVVVVASVGGVTTGAGVSGPGTGTLT